MLFDSIAFYSILYKQWVLEYCKSGVAKPLPEGKKVPAKAFLIALQTFLEFSFFKPYFEIWKTWY